MTKAWKKILTLSLTAIMFVGSLAGCGSGNKTSIDLGNPEITVMTQAFSANPADAESPVVAALEEALGTKLNFNWVPTSGYDEKVTASMGSGQYPHVMLINTVNSSVINASRNGIFWDITEKLKDAEKFPNLAQTNPTINHNISIDGKVYGVYRAKELGRAGVTIRKDWLDNVGLSIQTTMDEFYNVLKAFKEQDPDKNGENDTYGMIVTNYLDGPLNNIAIWMGAPNEWGVDADGNLAPDFTFKEYKDALDFMKKCYSEGLINQDMATYPSDKWNEQFLNGKAGVIIDVADRSRRIAQNLEGVNPEAEVDVFGYVRKDENTEPRTFPTNGYGGYFVFPTESIKTEEELDFVLGVMDKACGKEASDLMNYGILDRNYTVENGYAIKKEDAALVKEYADLNQFAPGVVDFGADKLKTKYDSRNAERVEEVFEDNKKYVVSNPAEPYVSDTYSTKGPQIDAILQEADVKYICGQISEDEWYAQIERWKQQGGQQIIEEINEAYKKDPSVKH